MVSTMSPPMMDGSISGSATTPPRLPWRAYGAGGTRSALPVVDYACSLFPLTSNGPNECFGTLSELLGSI